MKITDFFDKTVCINLDRRFDRWSECVAEFDKNKLSEILNIRKYIYNNDEQAAEFLENIDKSRPVFKKSAKPELPL